MGGRPIGAVSDVLLHERNRFRVFEGRDKELALHFLDLLLTEQRR